MINREQRECKYCQEQHCVISTHSDQPLWSNHAQIQQCIDGNVIYIVKKETIIGYIIIKYCPICGRKLTNLTI